jgi:hypothetical protein
MSGKISARLMAILLSASGIIVQRLAVLLAS